MKNVKDKLAASVRQARTATPAQAAAPAEAPPVAKPAARKAAARPAAPASVLPAITTAPPGFAGPGRVWPD